MDSSGDKAKGRAACSSLLEKAGLAKVMQELADLPEEQPLHVFLPDVCRSRYDVPDIRGQILPLLKPLFSGQDLPKLENELASRNFRDEELRVAFTIQPGPAPLPIKEDDGEEIAKALRLKKEKEGGQKRAREGDGGSPGKSKKPKA